MSKILACKFHSSFGQIIFLFLSVVEVVVRNDMLTESPCILYIRILIQNSKSSAAILDFPSYFSIYYRPSFRNPTLTLRTIIFKLYKSRSITSRLAREKEKKKKPTDARSGTSRHVLISSEWLIELAALVENWMTRLHVLRPRRDMAGNTSRRRLRNWLPIISFFKVSRSAGVAFSRLC